MASPNPDPAPDAGDPLAAIQDAVADLFGDIAAFWGFPRSQGRVYGLLLTSPHALGQRQVRERLGLSQGCASMTLASLVQWGALERRGRTYVAQTDLWRVITRVLGQRERAQVTSAIARLSRAVADLEARADPTDPAHLLILARARRLLDFFRLGRAFLDAFVARHPVTSLLDTIARRAARLPRAHDDSPSHVRIGA